MPFPPLDGAILKIGTSFDTLLLLVEIRLPSLSLYSQNSLTKNSKISYIDSFQPHHTPNYPFFDLILIFG